MPEGGERGECLQVSKQSLSCLIKYPLLQPSQNLERGNCYSMPFSASIAFDTREVELKTISNVAFAVLAGQH